MPGYKEVMILTAAQRWAKVVAEARENEARYELIGRDLDKDIHAEVSPMVRAADDYIKGNEQYVRERKDRVKSSIRAAEELVNAKKFVPDYVNKVDTIANFAVSMLDEIQRDNEELVAALRNEYRGGWPKYLRAAYFEEKHLNRLLDVRKGQIKFSSSQIQLTRRAEEYVTRSKDLLKLARARGKEEGALDEIADDVQKIASEMDDDFRNIDGLAYKVSKEVPKLQELVKKKAKTDGALVKELDGKLDGVEAKAKQMRGRLKTMKIHLANMKKRIKEHPTAAKMAKESLKKADGSYKDADKIASDLSTLTKKAGETLVKMGIRKR